MKITSHILTVGTPSLSCFSWRQATDDGARIPREGLYAAGCCVTEDYQDDVQGVGQFGEIIWEKKKKTSWGEGASAGFEGGGHGQHPRSTARWRTPEEKHTAAEAVPERVPPPEGTGPRQGKVKGRERSRELDWSNFANSKLWSLYLYQKAAGAHEEQGTHMARVALAVNLAAWVRLDCRRKTRGREKPEDN